MSARSAASLPDRLAPWLDAAILLALAGFIFRILVDGSYWFYLNPQFKWLTATAGALLALLGLAAPFLRASRFDAWRYATFGAFLALCFFGGSQQMFQEESSFSGLGLGGLRVDGPAKSEEPSRLTVDGKEYVKINLGELSSLAAKSDPKLTETNWAVRGFVIRHPDLLDPQGELGLFRIALYCCFTDSTALGMVVSGADPAAFQSGQWARVVGHVERREVSPDIANLKMQGIFSTTIESRHVFVAEKIEAVEAADPAFMYDWRDAEPYAY